MEAASPRTRSARTVTWMMLILASGLVLAPTASAQDVFDLQLDSEEDEAPGGPAFFVGGGFGATFAIDGGPGFALEESAGYRFLRIPMSEGNDLQLFGAVVLQQRFGVTSIYTFGLRGGADISLLRSDALTVLVTPMVSAGVGVLDLGGDQGQGTAAAFQAEGAVQGEVVLMGGTLGIWLRPVGVSVSVRDPTIVSYDFMLGLNVRL